MAVLEDTAGAQVTGIVVIGIAVLVILVVLLLTILCRRQVAGKPLRAWVAVSTAVEHDPAIYIDTPGYGIEEGSPVSGVFSGPPVAARVLPSTPAPGTNLFNIANLPENYKKNRYLDVLPYDNTRVVLKNEDDDYINASFLPGYHQKVEYILTQGPLRSTVQAFWTMVWECNSRVIIMMAKLVENKKEKVFQYWPDHVGEEIAVPNIRVILNSEDHYPSYVARTLLLKSGNQVRRIHHLQFIAWPDHGVPEDTTDLIEFRGVAREAMDDAGHDVGPSIVHCSAGVGRAGSFVVLDIQLEKYDNEGQFDIWTCVTILRQFRCKLIQTAWQYVFVHQAIVDAIAFHEGLMPSKVVEYCGLPDPCSETGIDALFAEYRSLPPICTLAPHLKWPFVINQPPALSASSLQHAQSKSDLNLFFLPRGFRPVASAMPHFPTPAPRNPRESTTDDFDLIQAHLQDFSFSPAPPTPPPAWVPEVYGADWLPEFYDEDEEQRRILREQQQQQQQQRLREQQERQEREEQERLQKEMEQADDGYVTVLPGSMQVSPSNPYRLSRHASTSMANASAVNSSGANSSLLSDVEAIRRRKERRISAALVPVVVHESSDYLVVQPTLSPNATPSIRSRAGSPLPPGAVTSFQAAARPSRDDLFQQQVTATILSDIEAIKRRKESRKNSLAQLQAAEPSPRAVMSPIVRTPSIAFRSPEPISEDPAERVWATTKTPDIPKDIPEVTLRRPTKPGFSSDGAVSPPQLLVSKRVHPSPAPPPPPPAPVEKCTYLGNCTCRDCKPDSRV